MQLNKPYLLNELADKINAELKNDANNVIIEKIATMEIAQPGDVTFLVNPHYRKYLATTKASAVIVSPVDLQYCSASALVTNNPRLSLAKLLQLCIAHKINSNGIHSSVVIGDNCNIADSVTIGPNCVIGNNCTIGDGSVLKPNVILYDNVKIGTNVTIHSGTVVGSDGFGYANDEMGNWVKIPHLGGVIIEDSVEIGSNTSIDRGVLENTIIGKGTIIDNLVQIGHNVVIGENTAIAGCVGIAGSTKIGSSCLIGGAANIAGHIEIGDKVCITGASSVNRSFLKPGIYSSGLPAGENYVWRKNVARFNHLDDLAKRVRELERSIIE